MNFEPEFVIVKARNATKFFTTYHATVCKGVAKILELNTNSMLQDGAFFGAAQAFDNTVFTVGNPDPGASNSTNLSGTNYVAYAWHSVPGFSAFGSYQGNNDPDGPFVYTGLRVCMVLLKRTDSTGQWFLWDSTRQPANPVEIYLQPNQPDPENSTSDIKIDFLSNGFKLRGSHNDINGIGDYVFAAFAENPFGGSNVSPSNAR